MKAINNNYFWVFFLIVLSTQWSCQKVTTTDLVLQDTPPEIKVFFDNFEAEAAKRNQTIDVEALEIYGVFESLSSNKGGSCSYGEDTPRKITINSNYWSYASQIQKAFLVYHELGHCALGLGHDDSQDENGLCKSIMASGTTSCRLWQTNEALDKYLDELFSKQK